MSFADGPPYSEDEDLHSPVVMTRQRKYKSTGSELYGRKGKSGQEGRVTSYFPTEADHGGTLDNDNTDIYYVDDAAEEGEDEELGAPGGEFISYPAGDEVIYEPEFDERYAGSDDDYGGADRYSRDYQFAVGCPDEEMYGRAVALFDFTREHENELPLCEGQVVYVSYRQSHGWLVAEDPKTGESGLVPEEFVRLLRDIEGGLSSLNADELSSGPEEIEASTHLSPVSTDSAHPAPSTTGESKTSVSLPLHPSKPAAGEEENRPLPVGVDPAQASTVHDTQPHKGSQQ